MKIGNIELIVGKKYKVILDDCCIEGEFTSVLKEIIEIENGETLYDPRLVFENGVILSTYNQVIFAEILPATIKSISDKEI